MNNIMKRFGQWYSRNQDAIAWFLIGMLSTNGVDALIRGEYFWAVINFILAIVNYKLIPVRV